MEKQKQTTVVHRVRLGERQRAPHKTAQPLAQNIVETFDMTSLPIAFACRPMLLGGKHLRVRLPEVRVQNSPLVPLRDALPQKAARLLASVPNSVGHNLARSSALSQPHPAFVPAPMDERPYVVHLQHVSLLSLRQRLFQRRQQCGFF